jgi:hypothetical protein
MSISCFEEKNEKPEREKLESALGKSAKAFEAISIFARSVSPGFSEEWKYYGKKAGWTLLQKSGKRTLFYIIPQNGFFTVVFVLGQKAVDAINGSELPPQLKDEINSAKKYVEGRSLRITVKTKSDGEIVKKLIGIKLHN